MSSSRFAWSDAVTGPEAPTHFSGSSVAPSPDRRATPPLSHVTPSSQHTGSKVEASEQHWLPERASARERARVVLPELQRSTQTSTEAALRHAAATAMAADLMTCLVTELDEHVAERQRASHEAAALQVRTRPGVALQQRRRRKLQPPAQFHQMFRRVLQHCWRP